MRWLFTVSRLQDTLCGRERGAMKKRFEERRMTHTNDPFVLNFPIRYLSDRSIRTIRRLNAERFEIFEIFILRLVPQMR